MFWSIISDYDLKTALCELIDNALDLWEIEKRKNSLSIEIDLDVDRQLITVVDNAGGVKREDLRLLLAPGGSKNDPDAQVIGIFGVGSKRAGIALGELVQIRTRFRRDKTFQIDITKDWLESADWEIPSYEVPDIDPGTTRIEISHVRRSFDEEQVAEVRAHLGCTYAKFLGSGCKIRLNGKPIDSLSFETWAYPPGFVPKRAFFEIALGMDAPVKVQIDAGLVRDRNPEAENYGVYFYCNNRLIVKELRTREVGYFVTSEAGVPHPDASLCRVVVKLAGSAKLMPWNSSKNGINVAQPVFQQLRPTVIQLTSHFSSLSRRLKSDWEKNVFRHSNGKPEDLTPANIATRNPLVLPKLPRVHKPHMTKLKEKNKKHIEEQPWTLGLVEAMGAVDIILKQRLETKSRIALILLDSNFEIALKEFIVHRTDLFPIRDYGDQKIAQIFARRTSVIDEVIAKVAIPKGLLTKVRHYYGLRNKLIHERATVDIAASDVENYRGTIGKILKMLFKLKIVA